MVETTQNTNNASDTFRVFKAELPNGEVKEKRFKKVDPVAVICCVYLDAVGVYQWTTKESRVKGVARAAEKQSKDDHGDNFKEVVVVTPVFVREETGAAKKSKKEDKADSDTDVAEAAPATSRTLPKKVRTKKTKTNKSPADKASALSKEDGERKFKTKSSAIIAARAIGLTDNDVEKSGSRWIVKA